ncbi:uncharacterized protein N7511_003765 [Penicillium nucicola]|uniref:uncharacterized protein n=1 Tax=Penicillium nucicola TaxID=1850975 RepID=UPI00254567CF|nr:uncharacterized protein N7511_003765 [Penicillium nucicola]KAJ5766149.1 hypothetical protein N7511_003765 [Penicillium nucicola]
MSLDLLHVTSSVSRILEADRNLATRVPFKAVRYEDVGSVNTEDWLGEREPEKLVRDALDDLIRLIGGRVELRDLDLVGIHVGIEQKQKQRAFSAEMAAGEATFVGLNGVLFNTSGV